MQSQCVDVKEPRFPSTIGFLLSQLLLFLKSRMGQESLSAFDSAVSRKYLILKICLQTMVTREVWKDWRKGGRVKIGYKEQMVFSTAFPPSFLSLHLLTRPSKCVPVYTHTHTYVCFLSSLPAAASTVN